MYYKLSSQGNIEMRSELCQTNMIKYIFIPLKPYRLN